MDKILITMKDYRRNISVDSDADMSGDEYTETFQDLAYLAEKEDRLVTGIFESARVLELCPEIVDMCVLPSCKGQDISSHIQQKLIQAFCWENDIHIVELDREEFSDLVKSPRSKSETSNCVECILLTSKPLNEVDIEADDIEDNLRQDFG
ncbi:hypothetical protein ACF0H5_005151 [Mactra antiquata]